MLLAVDIGNTNINCGIFKGSRITRRFSIATVSYSLAKLKQALGKSRPADAVICSVVPASGVILGQDLKRLLGKRPYNIGKDIVVPIKNLYRKPREVGQDRLVNAYAGVIFYGAPLVVADFGTAITFDVISRKKEYLGGMILPGLQVSLDALGERAALLPKLRLGAPQEFIGRDTKNSMLAGIAYGFAALADDLAGRIKNKIGRKAKFIGTGGNINFIAQYCRSLNKIDRDLTLKGLCLIYHYAQNK